MKLKTLFIQKALENKNQKGKKRKLIDIIHESVLTLHKKNSNISIFLSPGYLGTTSNSRKILTNKIFKDYQCNNLVTEINILNTMRHTDSIDYQYELTKQGFTSRPMPITGNRDHRKMLFIYTIKDNKKYDLAFKEKDKNKLIEGICNNINVMGVSIGSSNFSKTSYIEDVVLEEKSNKDEADFFLYYEKGELSSLSKTIDEINGESIHIVSSTSDRDINSTFLNYILKQTLKGTLR